MARELDPETKAVHDQLTEAMAAAADRLDLQGRGRDADEIRRQLAAGEMSMAEHLGEFDGTDLAQTGPRRRGPHS